MQIRFCQAYLIDHVVVFNAIFVQSHMLENIVFFGNSHAEKTKPEQQQQQQIRNLFLGGRQFS